MQDFTVFGDKVIQALDFAVPVVGQDEGREFRNPDLKLVLAGLFVRDCEQDQRHACAGFPIAFHGGHFGG
ncbi:MAG: hypothetical protein ACJAZ1_000001, partial [Yoonia sp.]